MPDAAAIRALAADEFWTWAALAAALALGALYLGMRRLGRARLIENTPTARIRSAPQGYVELSGVCGNPATGALRAPLSGSACAWYAYRVERRDRRHWKTVRAGRSDAPFSCDDGTGVCIVHPAGADISATAWQHRSGGLRLSERRLHAGDRLFAVGRFETANPRAAVHTLSRPRDRTLPFIVSTATRRDLAGGLRRRGWLAVAVFLAALGACAYLVSARFAT